MYNSFYSRHFGRDLQVGRPLFEVLFTMTSPTTEAWKPSFRTSTPLDPLKTNNNLTSYFMWDTSIYQHQALWTGPTLNPCGLSTVPHVCWLNPHVRWSKPCRFFFVQDNSMIVGWILLFMFLKNIGYKNNRPWFGTVFVQYYTLCFLCH